MRFCDLNEIRAACRALPSSDAAAAQSARARQMVLTKPPGSLGRLEDLAIWLSAWQGRTIPVLKDVSVVVFAANHGVTARGVSAYPASVTAAMVDNFAKGGAAINQLSRIAGAELQVIPLDLEQPTADFTVHTAMTDDDFLAAVNAGAAAVPAVCDLLVVGEMGIGNTTVGSVLCAALLGGSAEAWVGRGTGVDDAGLGRKRSVIEAGLARHRDALSDPLRVAAALGGRELAAIMGAVLAARLRRIPTVLDGFVATSAVLPLATLEATALEHCIAGHVSAEQAHRKLLAALNLKPLLDLGMRLGEASGGALAINILRAAVACHAGMATFESANIDSPVGEAPAT